MPIVGAIGGGLVIFLLLHAAAGLVARERRRVVSRLKHLQETKQKPREAELSVPFAQRVLFPGLRRVGSSMNRLTPGGYHAQIQRRLVLAGHPGKLGPGEFIGIQALGTVGGLVVGALASGFLPGGLVWAPVLAGAGYGVPALALGQAVTKRHQTAQKELPDALDLLTISVEAGLGFDAAMSRVVDQLGGVLGSEFSRVLQEVRLGKVRKEALRDLTRRIELDDLNSFIGAIVQAEQLGVSIAPVLRVQSKSIRQRRRQRAEEQAMKAPVKMLFPLVFFIFPGLFIVILGPAMIQILEFFADF